MPEGTLAYIVPVSGEGPVDPGFGRPPGSGGRPDNSLPPGFPPIGSTLPEPPPNVWPPITGWAPIQPAPPGTPPGTIWPPIGRPPHVDAGLPPAPARPGTPLPPSPGHPSGGPVPPAGGDTLPVKTWWVVVGIPGVGWRYAAIDPSLSVGHPLPPAPEPK